MNNVFRVSDTIRRISFIKNHGYPSDNIVGREYVILYLWYDKVDRLYKLGELTTLNGSLTDIDEINRSYRGARRVLKKQLTVLAFFVIPKVKGNGVRGYDHDVHARINVFSDVLGFRCPMRDAGVDENTEELVGYDHQKHFQLLVDVISDVFGGTYIFQEHFKPYNATQGIKLDEIEKTVRTHNRCLFNAHTAFGKSTCIIALLVRLCEIGDVALATTPIIDTLFDLLRKNERFFYGKPVKCLADVDLVEGDVQKLIEKWRKTHIVLICVSVQNIRYKDDVAETELRTKFSFLTKLSLKVWFRDEYHTQYNGMVTAKVLAEIKAEMRIDMTATVYKLLSFYNDYDPRMIIRCDNLWALLEKKRGNPDYDTYPMPLIECVGFDQLLSVESRKVFTDEAEDYREKKLFEMQRGRFVRIGAIIETFKYIVDGQVWATTRFITKKTVIGPLNDPDLPFDKVGIVRIPEGNDGNDAKTKIKVLKKELMVLEHAYIKTADEFLHAKKKHNKGGEGVLNDWLVAARKEGKSMVLILTHEQLGTGTDMPQASFAILFDRINSIDPFVQFFGRLQRRAKDKHTVKLYVLAPGMALQLSAQKIDLVRDIAKDETEAKEMHDCLPLTVYLDGKWKTVTYEQSVKNNDVMLRRHMADTESITHSLLDRFTGLSDYLADIKLDKTFKDGYIPATDELTDDTTGKTHKPSEKDTDEDDKTDGNKPAKINKSNIATLSVMLRCVPMLNLVEPCKKLEDIWSTKLAKVWFTEKQLLLADKAMTFEPAKPSFDQWFAEEKKKLEGRSLQEIVLAGDIFRDESFLLAAGTKFLPVDWTQTELVNRLEKKKAYIVFNALNGVLPCLLQKAYPNAKIICVEAEGKDFFVTFLTNMRFEVYPWDKKDHIIVKDINGKLIDKKDIAVVMNPPYNGNLDLQFFEEATKHADRIVGVHPAISTISRKDTKRFVEHKKLFDGHVKSIKLFNGNPVFGITLKHPCEIIDIDMGKTFKEIEVVYAMNGDKAETHTFKSLLDVTKWGNVPAYYSLEKKVLGYCETKDNVENHRDKEEGKWFVNIAGIRGHETLDPKKSVADDFYTIVTRDLVPSTSTDKETWLSFKTKEEAENMIAYLKTPFARFCLSILKNNANLHRGELAGVPYLPSYKTAWTDEKIAKEIGGITKAEWAFISKVIPAYYDV